MVPAVPSTIATASSSRPMAAMSPVTSTNRQAASTFGPIEPAGKSSRRSAEGVARSIGSACGVPKPRRTCRHVGEDEQHVGVERLGEHGRREVLVDHRLDALQPALLVADDRHATAAGADDHRAAGQQQPDEPGLHDPLLAGVSRPPGASVRRRA